MTALGEAVTHRAALRGLADTALAAAYRTLMGQPGTGGKGQ
jgi:hypothetical protein